MKSSLLRLRACTARLVVAGSLVGAGSLLAVAQPSGAVPPPSDTLSIATAPSSTVASGAAFAQQPVINENLPSSGIDTGDNTSTVVAALNGGVGSLVGTTTKTVSAGVATFTNLGITAPIGSYTITFSSTNDVNTVTTSSISVTVGAATQVAITTQPSAGQIIGSALATAPVVKVEDSGGNVVNYSGSATAAVNSGGCTISAGGTTSFSAGVATFTGLTLSGSSGASCTLTFAGDSFTSPASSAIALSTAATKLVIAIQPSASAMSGVALAQQPVVQVQDASSNVVAADSSSSVTATVTSAGGTVSSGTVSVVKGVATFSTLALNALVGSYTLTFSDGGLTTAVSNSISVTVGPAAKLHIATQPSSSVQSGVALAQQPVVFVEDSGGNIVTTNGSTVTATLTAGSGTVINPTAVAVSGIATFSGLGISAVAGLYSLTFNDGALTTAVSTSITVNSGPAAKLVIVTPPSTTVAAGAPLAVQPVIAVTDSGGNPVVGNSSTVTATITGGAYPVANGTAVVSPSTGRATFSALALNAAVGTYTLTFSDGALTTAVSASISVTPGTATKLVVTLQPSSSVASGAALSVQPVVKVEDAFNNVVTTDASTVTAKITTGGVSVTGGTAVAVSGVASFTTLALNALVGTYTLTFSDGSLTSAVSSSITVTVGAASQLVVTTKPSATAASGVALAQQPVVKVEDSGGNVVTSLATGSVTAAIYSGAGGAVSAGASAPISGGVAVFTGLTLTGVVGTTYTLVYSGASLSVVDTAKVLVGSAQAALSVTSTHGYFGRTVTLTTSGGSGTGSVTFALASGGTARGCSITGSTLRYASAGTCVVVATKAADSTYLSASSAATTVTISYLPVPGKVRVTFSAGRTGLTARALAQIATLSAKLTSHSVVLVTGYDPTSLARAKARAYAAGHALFVRVHVHVHYQWKRQGRLQVADLKTLSQ